VAAQRQVHPSHSLSQVRLPRWLRFCDCSMGAYHGGGTLNRGRRDLDETKRLRRRDCGLRNREVEAGNRSEAPKSLASKADCTERTGRCPAKSTSSVRFQSATTTPRQTSPGSILNDYSSVECEITPRNRFQSVLLPSSRCSKGF
jgi:hypothetical protein